MEIKIKIIIHRLLISAVLILGSGFCSLILAQDFPKKIVTLIVPYPAGGATDVIGRMVAEKLSVQWKQQVVVSNRPGAGTTIPLVMVVNPNVPVKSMSEFIGHAKAQKNGLTMASTGNGTPQHLAGELFKLKTGTPLIHIPYKGDTPMLTDLIGGQVQVAFVTLSAALPYINSGKLRPIALAHPQRLAAIPSVPTMTEAGVPDFSAATWFGIYGPSAMEEALRQKISIDIQKVVADPAMSQRLHDMGGEVNNSSPEVFQQVIASEFKNWSEAVRLSGALID